tara:strand:+ start:1600 stop:1788 length:189 start_codon:yes stop_codon:yes gene_type:complete
MEKSFYVPSIRINEKIEDTVQYGHHIVIAGYTYEKVSKRPVGRRVTRRLFNQLTNEKIVIYG